MPVTLDSRIQPLTQINYSCTETFCQLSSGNLGHAIYSFGLFARNFEIDEEEE